MTLPAVQRAGLSLLALVLLAMAPLRTTLAATVSAIEFYHSGFDHYFITRLPRGNRRARFGTPHGLVTHRSCLRGICDRRRRRCDHQSRVPLLHSAGEGRLAFLLGARSPNARRFSRAYRPTPTTPGTSTRLRMRSTPRFPTPRPAPVRAAPCPCTACGTSARIPIIAIRPIRASSRRCWPKDTWPKVTATMR